MPADHFDANLITIRSTIPRLWWTIYQGCIEAGFDREQSFQLLQTYILGQNPHGITPPSGSGPETDDPS